MAKARRLWTNFAKGELSPRLEGRPDLAAYFNGAKTLQNWVIFRQGGLDRRVGTRFVKEVKTSAKDTILIPFEFSVSVAYMLEFGDQYIRVYKNGAAVLTSAGGPQVEIASPYLEADLRDIHFTQSADVLYLFHPSYAQRKLSRVSDTSWTLSTITFLPPASYEADTGLAEILAPAANSGNGIVFYAASGIFLAGDVGRQIISGAGRAIIKTLVSATEVTADIIDAFSATITAGPGTITTVGTALTSSVAHGLAVGNYVTATNGAQAGQIRRVTATPTSTTATLDAAFPADIAVGATWNKVIGIASGSWSLRGSPQVTLDPDKKEPIGTSVALVFGAASMRSADVGKFVKVYGGLIKLTIFLSSTTMTGEILSVLSGSTTANPAAAAAGAWTLEVASWSSARGFPRTGEFYQGRLGQAGTTSEPTTFWFSASDDFENYAVGSLADNALEYAIAAKRVNRIEWLADLVHLFLGTAGAEFRAKGPGLEEPLGGDVVPLVEQQTWEGSAHIQPVVAGKQVLFVDRSRKRIHAIGYSIEEDGFQAVEITDIAEHIVGTGIRLGPIGYASRPDPVVYFIRSDGELVALTYFRAQAVVGFTRFITEGTFEAVAVIPHPDGDRDQVWVIVKRTINGVTKRYVEYFEDKAFSTRAWTMLETDSAKIYDGSATVTITGLSHLEAKTVDVVADGSVKAQKTVASGQITLDDAASKVEVGLHYESKAVTMRPAIEGSVIEGLPRSWDKVFVRLLDTIGGKVNGEWLAYAEAGVLYDGDVSISGLGWDLEGRITIEQTQPLPMSVLAVFGTLSVGGHD